MLNSDNNGNNNNNGNNERFAFKPIEDTDTEELEAIQKKLEKDMKEVEKLTEEHKQLKASIEKRKEALKKGKEALAKRMTLTQKRKAKLLEEEKQLLRLKKQKQQMQVIRFKVDEGCLPLTTRYISGDGCVSYVTRNDGTSVTLGDAYEKRTKVYGMRQISVNNGPRVECATDSLSTGAICYRADNGAIAPLWRLPDTAAMKAYRTIFRQCWKDSKSALPHCCDACKEHVVFVLERGKWKDVVLKCPNESCNKQYKITKFDVGRWNVGCYDISDVQQNKPPTDASYYDAPKDGSGSSSVTNGSSSSSSTTTNAKKRKVESSAPKTNPEEILKELLRDHSNAKRLLYSHEQRGGLPQDCYDMMRNDVQRLDKEIERVKKQIEQNKPPATKYETALDTLVKKEEENSEGDHPLCDETVIEFTNLDWENAPNNISLRALSTLLSVCSYQRDLLKVNILKKIMSLDLKSMESDIVEEYLLPEIEIIASMADTTLPQTWETMISLKAKIKRLFPEL